MANPGRSAPHWRSPYSNPELEYVYLGSPQASQGSPLLRQPEPVVSENPLILQPTAAAAAGGHVYGNHNQLGFTAAGCMQPGFIPVPSINFQPHQSMSHEIYPSTQFNDNNVWSSLDSDLLSDPSSQYKVTPEDISMVEAYAPPGFSRSQIHYNNTWPMENMNAMASEAQSSTRNTTSYGQPAMVQQQPGFVPQEYVMMGDTISESVSSTDVQIPFGYSNDNNNGNGNGNDNGNGNGNYRDSSSHPEQSNAMESDTFSPLRHLGEPRWAEQLLNLCAAAIASKNISRTQHLMWVLNDLASVVGDVNQRFAAHGLRALFCRITGRMEAAATFMRPRHHDQEVSLGPKTVHRALVKFHEYVPWHQNCYSVTCQTLLEVCAGKSRVHLIDIGAGKGIEWPIFIDALVSRPGGPPSILRMTMIRDLRREALNIGTAKSVNSEAADFMTRLVKFASLLGLHVEVNMVQKPLECVTLEDLKIREGEILAVVCQFRLHRLSEEAPGQGVHGAAGLPRLSPRDEFLAFVHSLQPSVFVLSDNDSDHCSHDFLTRFQSSIGFWWLCYESMDVGYADRDPEERQILEYEGSMMLLNTVACEGIARIERNERFLQWQRRITRAGFVPLDLTEGAKKASQNLIATHNGFWDVAFVGSNVVSLLWRKQPTTFTSMWRPAAPSCSKASCKCSLLHS